jgi:hypothetical protein
MVEIELVEQFVQVGLQIFFCLGLFLIRFVESEFVAVHSFSLFSSTKSHFYVLYSLLGEFRLNTGWEVRGLSLTVLPLKRRSTKLRKKDSRLQSGQGFAAKETHYIQS